MIKHIIIYIIICIIVISLLSYIILRKKPTNHSNTTSVSHIPNKTRQVGPSTTSTTSTSSSSSSFNPSNFKSGDSTCPNDVGYNTCSTCQPICNNYELSYNMNAPPIIGIWQEGIGWPPSTPIPVIKVDSEVTSSGATSITLYISDTTLTTYVWIGVNPYFIIKTYQASPQGSSFTSTSNTDANILKYNDYWFYTNNYNATNPNPYLDRTFTMCSGIIKILLNIDQTYNKNTDPDYNDPKTWIIYGNYQAAAGPNADTLAGSVPTAAECAFQL